METALQTTENNLPNLPLAKYTEDDKQWVEVVKSSSFLPRLQLYASGSDACKEAKIGIGKYGIPRSKDSIEDMTNQVDVLPLVWRFKALRMPVGENPLAYYNPKSPGFKQVQVDAEVQGSRCQFGIEFLVWIPTKKEFATMFFGSKTARRQAPALKTLLQERRAATLKVELITNKEYKWHGPVVVPCSTPLTDYPEPDQLLIQAEKFANPKETEIEAVEEQEAVSEGRVL